MVHNDTEELSIIPSTCDTEDVDDDEDVGAVECM
jgi:hypothetical protein